MSMRTFAENLTENIDEVTEAGLPDIFAGDNEVTFNAPGKAEAFKRAVARHFPADDELSCHGDHGSYRF